MSSKQLILDQLKRSIVFTIKDKGLPRPPSNALEKLLTMVVDPSITPSKLMASVPDLSPSNDHQLDIQFYTWIIDEANKRGLVQSSDKHTRRSSRHNDTESSSRSKHKSSSRRDRSLSASDTSDHYTRSSRHRDDKDSRSRKHRKSRNRSRSDSPHGRPSASSKSHSYRERKSSHRRRSPSPSPTRKRSSRTSSKRHGSPKRKRTSRSRSNSVSRHNHSKQSKHDRSPRRSRSKHRHKSRSRSRNRRTSRDRPSHRDRDWRQDEHKVADEPPSPSRSFSSSSQSWTRQQQQQQQHFDHPISGPPPPNSLNSSMDISQEYNQAGMHTVHPSRMNGPNQYYHHDSYPMNRSQPPNGPNARPIGCNDTWANNGRHGQRSSSILPPRPFRKSPSFTNPLPPFQHPNQPFPPAPTAFDGMSDVPERPASPPLITDPQPIPTYYEEFGAHLPPVPIPGTSSCMRGDTAIEYLSRTAAYDFGSDYSTMHLMDRFVGGVAGALMPNLGKNQRGFNPAFSMESCSILCTDPDLRPPPINAPNYPPTNAHNYMPPVHVDPIVPPPPPPLSIHQPSGSVAPLPLPGINRCRHWPTCHYASQNGQCRFFHPQEICPAYPDCPYEDERCSGIHPRYFAAAHDQRSNIFGSTLPFDAAMQRIQARQQAPSGGPLMYQPDGPKPVAAVPLGTSQAQPGITASLGSNAAYNNDVSTLPCKFGAQCTRNGCMYIHPSTADRFSAAVPDSQVEKVHAGAGWGHATGEDEMRLDDLNVYDDEFFS